MIIFPNSKINIGLNIVSKREDGYHNLETIFYPIEICDALEITSNSDSNTLKKDILRTDGLNISSNTNDNLVLKAINLLRQKAYQFPYLEINLLKKTPMGAGIGGGSSDATHTLLSINQMFKLNMSEIDIIALSSQLGADCPFFVNKNTKYAEGIGDILENIDLNLNQYYIYLVKPNVFISTKEAFANIIPKPSTISLKEAILQPIKEWKYLISNDFETSIFPKYRQIQELKEKFYSLGVDYASMTGSGASVYAISSQPIDNFEKHFNNCYLWSSKKR